MIVSVILVVSAFMPNPFPDLQPEGPVATALVLLPIAILPWRRRWPRLVLIVLLAVFGAAAALGTLSPGLAIAVGLATFQVSSLGPRRRAVIIAGCAILGIVLLAQLHSLTTGFDPRAFQFGLIVAFAGAAGDASRSQRAYIAALNERAERAVQTRDAEARRQVSEERLRIARDLHDAVAHQIAVISLNAGVATSAVDARPEKAKESLATIRAAARTVLGEIGDLMAMLRADGNGDGGPTPQAGLDRLDELVGQFATSGLDVHTRIEGDLDQVTGAVSLVAYRVAQEALTNAHKHGAEGRARVLVHVDADEVTVTVTNPMRDGVDPSQQLASSGLGLVGLRERVSSVRGAVSAGPATAGWKVEARLPLVREGTQ